MQLTSDVETRGLLCTSALPVKLPNLLIFRGSFWKVVKETVERNELLLKGSLRLHHLSWVTSQTPTQWDLAAAGRRAQGGLQGGEHLSRGAELLEAPGMKLWWPGGRTSAHQELPQWHFCLLPSLVLTPDLCGHLALHFGTAASPALCHLPLKVFGIPLPAFHSHQRLTQGIMKPNDFDL